MSDADRDECGGQQDDGDREGRCEDDPDGSAGPVLAVEDGVDEFDRVHIWETGDGPTCHAASRVFSATLVERAGRQPNIAGESRLLGEALAQWRGAPLADIPSSVIQSAEVPVLDEERLAALERRFDIELELGHHASLMRELQAATAEFPLRERFYGHRCRRCTGPAGVPTRSPPTRTSPTCNAAQSLGGG